MLTKDVPHSKIWHYVRNGRKELAIPIDYILEIEFTDAPKESARVIMRNEEITGYRILFYKERKVKLNVLYHALSHAKHYTMGFPHIVPKIPIKGHDWFLYYTLNEYNTNLIESQHFKKHFINFLKGHKVLTSKLAKSGKKFKKYLSERTEQIKVEMLSDFLRMKVLCDDFDVGSAPYDDLFRILKKEYYRILGYDFVKAGKKLFEEKFPPLPKERYTKEHIETILNFFNKRKRKGLKVYTWKK